MRQQRESYTLAELQNVPLPYFKRAIEEDTTLPENVRNGMADTIELAAMLHDMDCSSPPSRKQLLAQLTKIMIAVQNLSEDYDDMLTEYEREQ